MPDLAEKLRRAKLLDAKARELKLMGAGRDASTIERDWQTWLRSVGPRTFTGSFAPFHSEFWGWFWRLIGKRRSGQPISDEEQAFLAIWARGMGKSANVEWAAIAEGALIGKGYVLYVSGTQALADGHVQSIRERLESDEISRYYPHLGQPKVGKHGNQYGWRQDFLITASGWAIRPLGLDVGVRGGRVGDLRPSLIVFDDVDDHSDSPLVVHSKLETIARSIIPAGTRETIYLGAQNLIQRNGVFSQIVSRKTSVLSRRIVSGPYPAFEGLRIEQQQTADGLRNVIVAGSPTWGDFDLAACQKFLDDSGLEAFLAEYQHDFSASEQGRVIPEYDEARHVITWSQFERVFGLRFIPQHWEREVGHDVGFTAGHLSAWTWVATSAENSALPGLRFRYRGATFVGSSVDEQAEQVRALMAPDSTVDRRFDELPLVLNWRMSHEALSERITYARKYGLPFSPCNSAKTAGISQWRHYLRADHTKPHPFHDDEKLPDGKWRLGFPGWFDIVDDDQLEQPRDDRGLAIHRRQTRDWRYRPDQLGVAGMSQNLPMKADEDTCDSTRMITSSWGPQVFPLTEEERSEAKLAPHFRREAIDALPPDERDLAELGRAVQQSIIRKRDGLKHWHWSHEEFPTEASEEEIYTDRINWWQRA